MDAAVEARVAKIEGMIADLHRAAPTGGGIAVVDLGTLLSTLAEALGRVDGADAWARVGKSVLHPSHGVLAYASKVLDTRLKHAAGTVAASTPYSADRYLKPAIDLVTQYMSTADKHMKQSDITTIAAACTSLLKRTSNTKGLSAFQEALFGPLHQATRLAESLSVPSGALGLDELCELMVRLVVKGAGGSGGSQRVKRCALHLAGALCRAFPAETIAHAPSILKTYKAVMNALITSAAPEFSVAAGLLDGLCDFFYFSFSADSEAQFVGAVYTFACRGMELSDHTRYDVPRAALRLLQYHSHLFAAQLVRDFNMLSRLKTLTTHRNTDVVKHAVAACHPYAATVALGLAAPAPGDDSEARQQKRLMFRKFCEEGQKLLERANTHSMSLGAALLGSAALAVEKHSSSHSAEFILHTLLAKFRALYDVDDGRDAGGAVDEPIEAVIRYLPSFVNPIATAVVAVGRLSGDAATAVSDVLRLVWHHIGKPYIFASTRVKVGAAVARLLLAVYRSGQDCLAGVLSGVAVECITMSCLGKTGGDLEAAAADAAPSWPHVHLWLVALNSPPPSTRAELWEYPWTVLLNLSEAHYSHMASVVFDSLAGTMLTLLRSLDVSPPNATGSATPSAADALTSDMLMFTTLSRFWHAVCGGLSDAGTYARWALPLLSAYAEIAARHPYLGNVYTLLKGVVDTCEANALLTSVSLTRDADGEVRFADDGTAAPGAADGIVAAGAVDDSLPPPGTITLRAEFMSTQDPELGEPSHSGGLTQARSGLAGAVGADGQPVLSRPHAREFHLILFKLVDATLQRLPDMKDDLLVSCVTFLLSVPVRMVHLKKLATPLSIALTTGLSFPPLAELAVDALDAWLAIAPMAVQDHLAPKAVGILQSFLCAAHLVTEDAEVDEGAPAAGRAGPAAVQSAKQRQFEKKQVKKRERTEWDQLRDIQVSVATILGKLGAGRVAEMIAKEGQVVSGGGVSGDDAAPAAESWETGQRRVVLRLPFGEVKQDLALDALLPRVSHLALRSNDRKTKVAACEFLHSVLLWMVGTNAYSVRSRDAPGPLGQGGAEPAATPFHSLYRKLFPVVTELAVDPELIARQLFARLLMQLVHWLTRNVQYESKETMALLDAILQGLTSETNSALRDLCASACAEFVKYSLKHGADTGAKNITSITTRLYALGLHPNPWKRAGAALAFSRILPHLYGHEATLATHVLYIIYTGVLMLALSDESGHRQCLQHATALLGKCEAIAVRKAALLVRGGEHEGKRAGMPPPAKNLEDLADWLLDQCFYEERVARRWAMRLVLSLASCLPRYAMRDDGPKLWINAALHSQGGVESIVKIVESRITPLAALGLGQEPPQHDPAPTVYLAWAKELETCADASFWLVSHGLLSGAALQTAGAGGDSPSRSPKRRKKALAAGDVPMTPHAAEGGGLHGHCRCFFGMCVADAFPHGISTAAVGADDGRGDYRPVAVPAAAKPHLQPRRQAVLETLIPLVTSLCAQRPAAAAAFVTQEYLATLAVLLLQPSWLGLDPHAVATQTRMPRVALRGIEAVLALPGEGVLPEGPVIQPASGLKRGRVAEASAAEEGGWRRRVLVEAAAAVYRTEGKNVFDESVFTGMMARRGSGVGDAPAASAPARDPREDTLADTLFLIRGARGLLKAGLLLEVTDLVSFGLGRPGVLSATLAGGLAALPIAATDEAENRRIIGELWKLTFDLRPADETVVCLMGDPAPVSAHDMSGGRLSKTASLLPSQDGGRASGSRSKSAVASGPAPTPHLGSGRRGELFYVAHRAEITKHIYHSASLLKRLAEANDGVHGESDAVYHGRFTAPLRDAAAFAKAAPMSAAKQRFVAAARDHVLPRLLGDWEHRLSGAKTAEATPGVGWRLRDAVDILHHLLCADAAVLLSSGAPVSRELCLKFFNAVVGQRGLLAMPSADLRELCRAITLLLPFLLRAGLEPQAVPRLIGNELPIHHFEIFGADAEAAPNRHAAPYRTVVKALCVALAEGRSPWFLDALFSLFRGVGVHPLGHILGPALTAFFAALDEATVMRCADLCVAKVLDEDLPPDVRCAATYRIGLLALQRLPPRCVDAFYGRHAHGLHAVLSGDWPQVRDAEGCYSAVLSRTAALALLEAMYRMCSADATKGSINVAFSAALNAKKKGAAGGSQLSGKEMNDKLIRLAHSALTTPLFCKQQVAEVTLSGVTGKAVTLLYHQAAYNCLAAGLIATQNNTDLITRALFVPRKGHTLWDHIVDLDVEHTFDVETNFTYTRSAIQGLRNEWETNTKATSSFFAASASQGLSAASQGAPLSQTQPAAATQGAAAAAPLSQHSCSLAHVLANPAAPMADPEDEYMAEADGDVSAAASTHPTAAASTHPTAAAPAAPLKKGGGYSLRHELVSIPLATQKHVRELQSQPDDALLAGVKGDGEASGAGSKGDVSADTKTGSSGSGGKQSAETGVSTTPPSSTPGAASPGRGKATPRTDPNRGRAWFSTQEADVDFTPQVPLEGGGADGDLEVDTINRSPVMPTLLRLLIFLKELAGEDTTSHAPPGWMSELLGAITTAAALNVRVFIAKVVVNAPKLFERFAGLWVAPLIDVALETMQPGQLGVSYFLRDVATTVISWGEDVRTAGFDAEARVSRLLAVLLKACTDKKKAILQANLELVKMLIRQWKERVRINAEHKHIMLGWIAYPETDANYVRARVAGLQLLGVLLANGLPAYDKAVDVGVVTEGGFYDRVLAGLPPHPQQQVIPKELIDTAAEVVGLIMQQQSVKDAPSPTLYDKVMRKLRALHGNSQVENFLLFLGGVMKHYPPLVDEFLPLRILRFIPHAKGPYQPLILEIIDKRVQLFPTAYSELHPFVPDLLTGGSSDVQLLVFDIIGKALASGTPKDVHHYVTALSQDIKHKLMPLGALSLDARAALYDSWVKVWPQEAYAELSEKLTLQALHLVSM